MKINEIKQKIVNDPLNAGMTDQGWQPIFMASPNATLLLIGQAPGIKTQLKGEVFQDQSGERLREWLGVTEEFFYSSGSIAVLPLDFYFPGKAQTGDLPPRAGFSENWHPLLLNEMPNIQLTILIGRYAQKSYLGDNVKKNLTQTVYAYHEYLPEYFPIPHPSPLNFRWLNQNKWFEQETLPELKRRVARLLVNN